MSLASLLLISSKSRDLQMAALSRNRLPAVLRTQKLRKKETILKIPCTTVYLGSPIHVTVHPKSQVSKVAKCINLYKAGDSLSTANELRNVSCLAPCLTSARTKIVFEVDMA